MTEIRENLINELERTEEGTEEYSRIFENLMKLERLELEQERNKEDVKLKEHQKKRDIWDMALKHGTTLILGFTGIGVYIFLFAQGMGYEKEDTFRSTTMRNLLNKNPIKLYK